MVSINPSRFGYPFPRVVSQRKKGERITVEDKMAILWMLAHDWSILRICGQINSAYNTVFFFRQGMIKDPSIIAKLPVIDVKGKRKFQCRLCRAVRPTRIGCLRHVMSHVLPLEVARDYPLGDLEKNIL